jgi:hypothetical protein
LFKRENGNLDGCGGAVTLSVHRLPSHQRNRALSGESAYQPGGGWVLTERHRSAAVPGGTSETAAPAPGCRWSRLRVLSRREPGFDERSIPAVDPVPFRPKKD